MSRFRRPHNPCRADCRRRRLCTLPQVGQISLPQNPTLSIRGENAMTIAKLRFAGALKVAAGILVALAFGANAARGAPVETLRYAITRNGDQIGMHTVEINRGPKETSVTMSTEL